MKREKSILRFPSSRSRKTLSLTTLEHTKLLMKLFSAPFWGGARCTHYRGFLRDTISQLLQNSLKSCAQPESHVATFPLAGVTSSTGDTASLAGNTAQFSIFHCGSIKYMNFHHFYKDYSIKQKHTKLKEKKRFGTM